MSLFHKHHLHSRPSVVLQFCFLGSYSRFHIGAFHGFFHMLYYEYFNEISSRRFDYYCYYFLELCFQFINVICGFGSQRPRMLACSPASFHLYFFPNSLTGWQFRCCLGGLLWIFIWNALFSWKPEYLKFLLEHAI